MQAFLPKQHTAIIIFGRTLSDEIRAKKFVKSNSLKANKSVGKALLTHTKSVVSESEIPSYFIDSNHQEGKNFGDKLHNAFVSVFNKGYQNVILVGTDCPSLGSKDLTDSANLLRQNKAVIGPDKKGGAYLIALSKKAFETLNFAACRWEKPELFNDLIKQLNKAKLSTQKLNVCSDINGHIDALKYFLEKSKDWFCIVLANFFTVNRLNYNLVCTSLVQAFKREHFLRGPPCFNISI